MVVEGAPVAAEELSNLYNVYHEGFDRQVGLHRRSAPLSQRAATMARSGVKAQWEFTRGAGRTALAAFTAKEMAERRIGKPTPKRTRKNPAGIDVTDLLTLLALARTAQWYAWTCHWQASGTNSYSDHLMLQRIYESFDEFTDDLGEQIIRIYGTLSANQVLQLGTAASEIASRQEDPLHALAFLLSEVQRFMRKVWKANQDSPGMSLGLDDLLMGAAKKQEVNQYLLGQRLKA